MLEQKTEEVFINVDHIVAGLNQVGFAV